MKTGILSIHEPYALSILNGTKQYEYRRKAPRLEGPTRFLIYATTPRQELVGEMVIDTIVTATPEQVWRKTGALGGIDRATFMAYFDGAGEAHALHVASVKQYERPMALSRMRERMRGFSPPQFFAWLTATRAAALRRDSA